jgi:hypothetical protein
MSTKIDYAHKVMESVCEGNAGVAIGADIFTFLVKRAVDTANTVKQVEYPSGTDFEKLPITFTGQIDAANIGVALKAGPTTDPLKAPVLVELSNIGFAVSIYLGGVLMSEHSLDCSMVSGSVAIEDDKIIPKLGQSKANWKTPVLHWEAMTTLPDGRPFPDDLKKEWMRVEGAVSWTAEKSLPGEFFTAVEIPNVIKMFTSVNFIGPIKITGADDLIVLSGPSEWVFGCPTKAANRNLSFDQPSFETDKDGRTSSVGIGLRAGGADSTYDHPTEIEYDDLPKVEDKPPTGGNELNDSDNEAISFADVFVHVPKVLVEKRFDGIVKPTAGFVDEGKVGPIRWHYEAAAAMKNNLKLTMTSLWPLEFMLEIPLKAFGVAGAGIKIGCVYYEAVGAAFDGDVDPFELFFKLRLDFQRAELVFESRFGQVKAKNFQFHHWPNKLDFPMDAVADFVLARVAEFFISSKSRELISVSRFALIEYEVVRGFGPMVNAIAARQSAARDAVTVGVMFQK